MAACGESLGSRAALYSTAYAADDLAAILEALEVRQIDLYGDSYGTYFEQVFAVRHPAALRAIVLDGAYPLDGARLCVVPDVCTGDARQIRHRLPALGGLLPLPGSSMDHILAALAQLRREPFAARAADSDGNEHDFDANATQLAIVMFGSCARPCDGARSRRGRARVRARRSSSRCCGSWPRPSAASIRATPTRTPRKLERRPRGRR